MPGTTLIRLEQYHERYSNEHGYEYWFGEVVRKPAPTWLHSMLQALLGELFTKAGYIAGSELDLRIDRDGEPRPDLAATLKVFDPEPKQAWQWNRIRSDLEQVSDQLALQNGATITLEKVWSELERRVHSGRAGDFDQ